MTGAGTLLLRADAVTVRAGRKTLVGEVDFGLRRGHVDALVGPNGAGKSTLLRALAGEIRPDAGTVFLGERPLQAYGGAELARCRACLPQASSLAFPFTLREVVAIGRYPRNDTRAETEAAVDDALARVGLLERAGEAYPHLSGGEKQRVHLARVLAQLGEPEGSVLLLDEPTASLDLTFQQLVFDIAADWAAKGAAVLLVLHDLNQAMRFGDTVTVLDQGRVAARGAPAETLKPDLIERVYGVRARWVESGGHRLLAVEGPSGTVADRSPGPASYAGAGAHSFP